MKESLRLYSPADITSRVTLSDVEIGGYCVPAETYVLLHMDAIQRSCRYSSNPLEFDPQRFDDDQSSIQPSHTFCGCGPYMCIGNKFALMEMTVVLATLVKRFSFHEGAGCVVKEVI